MSSQRKVVDEPEEDFPGQLKESKRQHALERAVAAADHLLVMHADGDVDELMLVTLEMAEAWLRKLGIMVRAGISRAELMRRISSNANV